MGRGYHLSRCFLAIPTSLCMRHTCQSLWYWISSCMTLYPQPSYDECWWQNLLLIIVSWHAKIKTFIVCIRSWARCKNVFTHWRWSFAQFEAAVSKDPTSTLRTLLYLHPPSQPCYRGGYRVAISERLVSQFRLVSGNAFHVSRASTTAPTHPTAPHTTFIHRKPFTLD